MKYLKKFNEAIVDYKSDSIKSFYEECLNKIKEDKNRFINVIDMKEIGDRHGIEVVDYKTFFNELSDNNKKGAPNNGITFALVNPDTNKPRIVYGKTNIEKRLLDHIYHMLKHENIHIGQIARSGGKNRGEGINIKNKKEYFSNKEEIMAFSQSISDMLMKLNPKNIKSALMLLNRNQLWNDIKEVVDKDVLQRYQKYIYLYLEKEFEN